MQVLLKAMVVAHPDAFHVRYMFGSRDGLLWVKAGGVGDKSASVPRRGCEHGFAGGIKVSLRREAGVEGWSEKDVGFGFADDDVHGMKVETETDNVRVEGLHGLQGASPKPFRVGGEF